MLPAPAELSVAQIEAETAALAAAADADALADPLTLACHLQPNQVVARAHLRVIAGAVRDVEAGTDDRLLIMLPPQCGKSTVAAQWSPFWWLARHPTHRISVASYASWLAVRHGRAVRRMVDEHGHRYDLRLRDGEQAMSDWTVGQGGGLRSVGVGAGLTGLGADLLIVDDPHKDRADADSYRVREMVYDWWSAVGLSRLAPGAPVILVQTRWHLDDLAGRVLAEEGDKRDGGRWRVVHLPATATRADDPLGRQPGEPLPHPRIPVADRAALVRHWADKKATSVVRDWFALYQGDPQPVEGALLSERVLRGARHDHPDTVPQVAAVAVDPSGGGRDTAGIVAGWLGADGRLYWCADRSGVMPVEQWAETACRLALEVDADRVVVESNFGGKMATLVVHSAWDKLAREEPGFAARMKPRIVEVRARKGKLLRAEPIAQQVVLDRIRLVGALPDLAHEWSTWQPTDPDSPGRIDASVYLAYALLGPPRGAHTGGSAVGVSRQAVAGGQRTGPGVAGVPVRRAR